MRFRSLRPLCVRPLALLPAVAALAFVPTSTLRAQTDYAAASLKDSGKILVIVKEDLKPGKDGAAHEKTEMQFSQAMAAAKNPDYYMAATSMSGAPRALFLSGYSSLADLEAKRKAVSASLGATLDKINEADGAVLNEVTTGVFVRRDSLSTNVKSAPGGARYLEITRFEVKAGHENEFEDAAKLYLKDMVKGVPDAHWTCYESYYGQGQGAVYLFMTALKSLAEADTEMMHDGDFAKAAGGDLKKLSEMLSNSVLSEQTNLFRYSPRLSYASPEMVAADPDFWTVKPVAVAKKAVAKP